MKYASRLCRFFLITTGFWVCGCSRPVGIEIDEPPGTIYTSSPFQISAHAVDKDGNPMYDKELTFSGDRGVLEDLGQGTFQCLKSEDATVRVSLSAKIAEEILVSCRIVDRLELPSPIDLLVGGAPYPLNPDVFAGNRPLNDVPIEVRFLTEGVARYRNGRVEPVSFGRTTILANVGNVESRADVIVATSVLDDRIRLDDGGMQDWELAKGNYRIEIQVSAENGSRNGVTLSWFGAFCENQDENQVHGTSCAIDEQAILRVQNPTILGLGPAVMGRLKILRVPPETGG